MDEIIDIVDEKTGLPTGQTISKKEAHAKGIWHGAIHILIVNKDKTKTLFQQRCSAKNFYPNTWDISVGGHISKGETPFGAACRELEEELGLKSQNYDLREIATTKESLTYNEIISNEFVTTYLIETDLDISQITLQKEEVSAVKWFTKEEVNQLVKSKENIPHAIAFDILNDVLK